MSGSGIPAGVIAEAVTAAKAWLRVVGDEEAAVLARVCGTAIHLAEAFLGGAVVARTFEDVLGAGGGWQRLRMAPVMAIAGVTGLPAEGAPFVLPVGAYAIDIDGDGIGWVRIGAPGTAGRVAVSYTAGIAGDWAGVPVPIAQGIAMLVAHLFDRRGDEAAPPAAVAALWRPYRRMRLAVEARS